MADGGLFIGALDGTFFRLDAATGAKQWSFTTGGSVKTAAVSDGVVYVPSRDGLLYALDAKSGKELWRSRGSSAAETNNPAVFGDVVVETIDAFGVWGFDAKTGKILWSRPDLVGDFSSPVIAQNVVYIDVIDDKLMTLDLKKGKTISSISLGEYASAPAIADGRLYVVASDGAVYAFDPLAKGQPAPTALPAATAGSAPANAPLSNMPDPGVPQIGTFVRMISTATGPNDPFAGVEGIAVDSTGVLYAIDAPNNRIVVYRSDGTFEKTIGKAGSEDGEFAFITSNGEGYWGGLAIGPADALYVTDVFNLRMQKFDASGAHLATFGPGGTDFVPSNITVNSHNKRVYVTDFNLGEVDVYDLDGAALGFVGDASAPARFATPMGVVARDDGSVWVAEYDGNIVTHIGVDGAKLGAFGKFGIAGGRFNNVFGVAQDGAGRLFVADYHGGRVQVFDQTGRLVGMVGSAGSGDGQFLTPTYLAFGSDGALYVSDETANRIQIFHISG
jgi:outer membrane protein assembly factor BamB